ncbi:MAG: elongation factor 4 [Candidatus Yanofskybacteria bacterium]|nr:elongation factor 4 [Candidatus Yanofskybacteria bacterium]
MQNIRNFCIIAHIDHGKSTLADRFLELTGTVEKRKMHEQFLDQMELERERGITIKLQPVRMSYALHAEHYALNLIDTPGHVDFSYEVSRSLAAVEGAILLVDATKGVQAQTLANLHLAQKQGLVIIPVINKIDLPNAKVSEVEEEIRHLLPETEGVGLVLKISAKTGEGVPAVLESVVKLIPAPQIANYRLPVTNSLRALIFDSSFDIYKGVIAYVRVFDGSVKAGERIKLFASKAGSDVIEVGCFMPRLKKEQQLLAGEIGYIATGLKNPGQVRVGDTIFKVGDGELAEALHGYLEPKPMVFASFYPESSDDYDTLKDALGKLKLTDASLVYEPESSPALGRGFRLGFLGMLHIEIVSERLRREFGLALIVSTPSVEYHVATKRVEVLKIRSAAALPDPGIIESIEEPIVELEILSPVSYMGQLMKLLAELRSQYRATDYLSKEVAILKYLVPLSEIITDFYDRLKSVSSGYASMSYEPSGYQVYDLVRLDILVAEERVEPFSKIVPREQAYYEGRRIVEKLKKILPRQWFTVSLQAAIGGKIIARETIPALRKDVTGYLYGGDVTRKKKLLEKQKRGKAKMKERGRVEIPQKVFLEMLKK